MTIMCRTVLDLRSPLDKYISQTLLLAASWHRHCADHSRLEVLTVGPEKQVFSSFLEALGIRHAAIPPSQNDHFSKSSNKIEASYADPEGRPVLLVDNDICFLGKISELAGLHGAAIAASVAGTPRVSDAQWMRICQDLGVPLLRRKFTPVNLRPVMNQAQEGDGFNGDDPGHYLYLNSGVALFPTGHDHRSLWRTHQRRIYEFFRDHPLRSDAVTTSDQAGFAASVAAHGEFTWLPLRFNYRHGCFRIGMESADRIRIIHLTGDIPDASELGLAERTRAYWQKFIFPKIRNLPQTVEAPERLRREEIALAVQASVLDIIREYNLEAWLDSYRKSQQQPCMP